RLSPRSGAHWTCPLMGHEFHYATTVAEGPGVPLFDATDAECTSLAPMGLQRGRIAGSFAHVIASGRD
ncbi:MAG: cobyrinic acid a,c-diamide synthase, partial [Pseudomonadota bacterium]